MKRQEFIRELQTEGCLLHRRGGHHDIYINPLTGRKAPIPRHNEVKEGLCRLIRKQLGIER